jgi:hypothetical protein
MVARLHIPGAPPEGFRLRNTDQESIEELESVLSFGDALIPVLVDGELGEAQVVQVHAGRLPWFSIQQR